MTAAPDYKQMYEQTLSALSIANEKYNQALVTIAAFEHELAQLKKMIFGSRHECTCHRCCAA
jgi:hypothetical protein